MEQNKNNNLKNSLYQIMIGKEGDKDTVINKKLRNIINTDIHDQPLGCKISNTHVKIGNIHLDTFFEAQILFSHAFWVDYFAEWIVENINKVSIDEPIILIGYESYIEPVLFSICQKRENITYGIFEEKKFVQNKGQVLSDERIRYFEELDIKDLNKTNSHIFYICGISSTLKTFSKMQKRVEEYLKSKSEKEKIKIKNFDNLIENANCLSLIQVLPKNPNENINKIVNKKDCEKTVFSEANKIYNVRYLVDVKCNWYIASECPLCFPENPLDEKPIIQTSETSVVPIQMIERNQAFNIIANGKNIKINLFRKHNGKYVFSDYLYYDHIDRMDHHFKYYIRTGHLLKDILDDKFKKEKKVFINYCQFIKEKISTNDKNVVDVIVSPSHFSNEVFPNVINQYVFDGKAHTISFDTNKEFRSNFEIKYSNYSYFLEQIKGSGECSIRFHYVDDQLISGESFYRAKSLITSLMNGIFKTDYNAKKDKIHIFNDVIVFLSRHSTSSRSDYIDNLNMYFSFIDIAIPSIRNYGDSCPICKQRWEALSYSEKSTLNTNAIYWYNKYNYYEPKSITKVKKEADGKLIDRYFLRFDCENKLWIACNGCYTQDDYTQKILDTIYDFTKGTNKPNSQKCIQTDAETIISFVKAISRPFLFYKENEKKSAFYLLLNLIDSCLHLNSDSENLCTQYTVNGIEYNLYVVFANNETKNLQKYHLIKVLLNCLAKMDSNYLLNVDRIEALINTISLVSSDNLDEFKNAIQYAIKRIICGIGGDEKSVNFERQLEKRINFNSNEDALGFNDLLLSLFFENIKEFPKLSKKFYESNNKSNESIPIIEKYSDISNNSIAHEILDTLFNCEFDEIISIHFVYMENKEHIYSFDGLNFANLINNINIIKKDWVISNNTFVYKLSNLKEKNNSQMYMVIAFEKTISSIKQYSIIRSIISYRNSLMEIIDNDIATDAIKIAIQASSSLDILLNNNRSNHGTVKSIKEIILITKKIIERNENKDLSLICSLLNLLFNHCISTSNAINFMKEYYDDVLEVSDAEKELGRESPIKDGFVVSLEPNTNPNKQYSDFLFSYFEELKKINENNHPYFKFNNSQHTEIQFEIVKDKIEQVDSIDIAQEISKVKYFPSFLNASTMMNTSSIIILIGIINVFLKNTVEHSNCKNVLIKIVFENHNNGYSLSVLNSCLNNSQDDLFNGKRLTTKFFDYLNKNHNQYKFFEVNMGKKKADDKMDSDYFISTIKICKKENSNEY